MFKQFNRSAQFKPTITTVLKFARDRRPYLRWLSEAKKLFGVSPYLTTS